MPSRARGRRLHRRRGRQRLRLVRLLTPNAGTVRWGGEDLHALRPRTTARQLGFLPQGLTAPENTLVRQLVARGRYPHQSLLATWSPADGQAVAEAMAAAGVAELAERRVEELSGGQRRRVWVAMVLAQETPYLLLDEPTTFLDLAHQYQLLRLLARLRDEAVRSSRSSTTSTRPAASPTTWWRCAAAGWPPRAHPPTTSTPPWSRRSSTWNAWWSPIPSRGHRWWSRTRDGGGVSLG